MCRKGFENIKRLKEKRKKLIKEIGKNNAR